MLVFGVCFGDDIDTSDIKGNEVGIEGVVIKRPRGRDQCVLITGSLSMDMLFACVNDHESQAKEICDVITECVRAARLSK